MKRPFVCCLTAFAALVQPAAAEARDWYVAASGSVSQLEEEDQRIANAPAPGSTLVARNDMESGWGFALAAGGRFGPVRAEIELGRTSAESDSYQITAPFTATVRQDGEVEVTRAMLNGYFDFGDAQARLRPFVGLGVGQAEVSLLRIAGLAANPAAPPFRHVDDEDTGLAWQAMAGASWRLTDRLALTAQLRHFDAGDFEVRDFRGEAVESATRMQSLDVGLRWSF